MLRIPPPAARAAAEAAFLRYLKGFVPERLLLAARATRGVRRGDDGCRCVSTLQSTYAVHHIGADVEAQQLLLKSLACLRIVMCLACCPQVRSEER